jgi:hypothetical protein
MRLLHFILLFFISFFIKNDLSAQAANAFADKSGMFVGDHATFTIFIQEVKSSNEIISIAWDSISKANFEVLEKSKIESNSPYEQHFSSQITSFEAGEWTIPPIPILIRNEENDTISIFTQPVKINVFAVEPDSTGLLPIKDIIVEEKDFSDYYLYVLLVLGILVSLGFFIYWKNKKMRRDALIYEQSQTPKAKALRRLEKLETMKVITQEDSKYFSSEISDLLRRFLAEEYDFSAMKMTTSELISFCEKNQLLSTQHVDLQQVLNITDFVKFAQGDAQSRFYQEAIASTRKMILSGE